MSRQKFYCGDRDNIPDEYDRRGSRVECLRKGFGVGKYTTERELKKKYGINDSPDYERKYETPNQKERRFSREEKETNDKSTYKKFFNEYFDEAKSKERKNKKIGDVFKQLSILWRLKEKIKRD